MKYKIGDMVEYQDYLAIVVDIPDPNVLELYWINAPDYFEDVVKFQLAMMIKSVD
jgi:hypothetical protein